MSETRTDDERKAEIAQILGCNPFDQSQWPMELVNRLLDVEKMEGREAMIIEVGKAITPPIRPRYSTR